MDMNKRKVNKVFFCILFLLGFFGLVIFYYPAMDYLYLFLLLIMAVSSFMSKKSYSKAIRWYVLFVFMSCVYSTIYNHQSFSSVVGHSYNYWGLLLFFVLMKNNLTSKETIKVMEMLALTFCICYIIQWIVYPIILFPSVRYNVNSVQYRGRMAGSICCYFILLYSINRYLLVKKWKYIVYAILGAIPIIILGFRTMMALSAMAAFLMIPFVLRSGRKTILYSILGGGVVLAALSTSLVQSKMDEMMTRQEKGATLDNDDYVRFRSFDYYWNQQFTKPCEKVIGGGEPADVSSRYYKTIRAAKDDNGFYWSDLGLVGLSMIIGIPAVLLLIFLYVKCMWKCKEPQIQFIRFTLFVVLVGSLFLNAELYRDGNILLFSLFLYFEYKYHQEQKRLQENGIFTK